MTFNADWTPISLSVSVEPETSSGTQITGKELVVWRDKSGVARVWEDRCPHRGMRLSFGFVRGDHIACLYHGWQFDTGGQCQYIPAHPQLDVPKTIKVPRYEAIEAAGMIWTKLTGDEAPDFPPLEGEFWPVRSLYLDCYRERVVEIMSASATVTPLSGNLLQVAMENETMLAGFQNINETRIGIHFSVRNSVPSDAPEIQIRLLQWIAGLRFAIENPGKSAFAPSLAPVKEAN